MCTECAKFMYDCLVSSVKFLHRAYILSICDQEVHRVKFVLSSSLSSLAQWPYPFFKKKI